MSVLQGTVADFDAGPRTGSVFLDDGSRLPFDASCLEHSGIRLLRPGQRVRLEVDGQSAVVALALLTMPLR